MLFAVTFKLAIASSSREDRKSVGTGCIVLALRRSVSICLNYTCAIEPYLWFELCSTVLFTLVPTRNVSSRMRKSKACACTTLSGRQCTLSRKFPGQPVVCPNRCRVCFEFRCKTHCKCGRDGTALGRNAPRTLATVRRNLLQQTSLPPAAPSTEEEPPRKLTPAGPPSPTDWCLLSNAEWWAELLRLVRSAREVELTTLTCDEVHEAFC